MPPLERFQYQRLPLSEDSKTETKSPFLPRCLYLIATLLALPAVLFCIILLIHLFTPQSQRYTSCGSSPDEARSRGCHFDILSFAWQTQECYDAELMDDFLSFDDWKFYTEFNTTDSNNTIDTATALEGNTGFYVDWKYHVTHCTFMWRQMHRAFTVRGYIDSHLDNYKHTLHCQKTLLDAETAMDNVVVIAMLRYPECREVGGSGGGEMRAGGY